MTASARSSSLPHAPAGQASSQMSGRILAVDAREGDLLQIPGGPALLGGSYLREGANLWVIGPGGVAAVVRHYFSQSPRPTLISAEGSAFTPDIIEAMVALPAGRHQPTLGPSDPVGLVDGVAGEVFFGRADGTRLTPEKDTPLFAGDVIETGAGRAALALVDGTRLSLGEGTHVNIERVLYDPAGRKGEIAVSVEQGSVAFVAGDVARGGLDALTFHTPTAVVGAHDAAGAIRIAPTGETAVVLLPGARGPLGEIAVVNGGGMKILDQAHEGATSSDYDIAPATPYLMTVRQIGLQFGDSVTALPEAAAHFAPVFLEAVARAHAENPTAFAAGDASFAPVVRAEWQPRVEIADAREEAEWASAIVRGEPRDAALGWRTETVHGDPEQDAKDWAAAAEGPPGSIQAERWTAAVEMNPSPEAQRAMAENWGAAVEGAPGLIQAERWTAAVEMNPSSEAQRAMAENWGAAVEVAPGMARAEQWAAQVESDPSPEAQRVMAENWGAAVEVAPGVAQAEQWAAHVESDPSSEAQRAMAENWGAAVEVAPGIAENEQWAARVEADPLLESARKSAGWEAAVVHEDDKPRAPVAGWDATAQAAAAAAAYPWIATIRDEEWQAAVVPAPGAAEAEQWSARFEPGPGEDAVREMADGWAAEARAQPGAPALAPGLQQIAATGWITTIANAWASRVERGELLADARGWIA
ncbi:MAG: FecR domain-containing protein, partial [Alphaproteobacteria bacterium]|nr:FecR domain-containing protein [Alphaproteobacteria bacterium]